MNNLVYLTPNTEEPFTTVASMENRISVLLDVGMSYQQIKNSLLRVKRLET